MERRGYNDPDDFIAHINIIWCHKTWKVVMNNGVKFRKGWYSEIKSAWYVEKLLAV